MNDQGPDGETLGQGGRVARTIDDLDGPSYGESSGGGGPAAAIAGASPGIEGIPLAELVTIGITAFRRPWCLVRLQASIRRFYPDLPVVVLETDSNLSRGRNELARAVATPFLLLCEDDFEFCEQTRIEVLVDVLAHDAEIGGVGGEMVEEPHPRIWAHNYHRRGDEIVMCPSTDPIRRTPGGVVYQPCQLIFNFVLFRRELLRQVSWDEDMPLNEHMDYYWRVSRCTDWRMAVARGIAIIHHRDRTDEEYCRLRLRNFKKLVDIKHGAHFRTEDYYVWGDGSRAGGDR
jgi:hypothetical protein